MSRRKSKDTSENNQRTKLKERHDLGSKENYLIKTDQLLNRLDESIQRLATQINSQEGLHAASAKTVHRLKYYQRRLIDLRIILQDSDMVQLEAIKAEASLLFERVVNFIKDIKLR